MRLILTGTQDVPVQEMGLSALVTFQIQRLMNPTYPDRVRQFARPEVRNVTSTTQALTLLGESGEPPLLRVKSLPDVQAAGHENS